MIIFFQHYKNEKKPNDMEKVVYLSKIRKMKTYRFRTKVSQTGTIQVPESAYLHDKEVEVILVPRLKEISEKTEAKDFVTKWAGFLHSSDVNRSRYEYLSEKYK